MHGITCISVDIKDSIWRHTYKQNILIPFFLIVHIALLNLKRLCIKYSNKQSVTTTTYTLLHEIGETLLCVGNNVEMCILLQNSIPLFVFESLALLN